MKSPYQWRAFAAWLTGGLLFHLVWEVLQLPLYTIWLNPDKAYIAFAVIHCLAGDALISAAIYIAVACGFRDPAWAATRPWRGAAMAIPLAVFYTAASEWYNVYHAQSWHYMPSMPLLFGVGLAPLLQWIAVPVATVLAVTHLRRVRAWVRDPP